MAGRAYASEFLLNSDGRGLRVIIECKPFRRA